MDDRRCIAEGCEREMVARSVCHAHYEQFRRRGKISTLPFNPLLPELSLKSRLESKLVRAGSCLVWMGTRNQKGYGSIMDEGKKLSVHRVYYEMKMGQIPKGYVLDHYKCHNPPCCELTHLKPVSSRMNSENRRGAQVNSSTGVRGVSPHKGKYRAEVMSNRRKVYSEVFDTLPEAEEAVIAARLEHHTHSDLDVRGVGYAKP